MDRSPKMNNRGGSYGGGQSSLGYLFGGAPPPYNNNDNPNKKNETTLPSPPPYGIDSDVDNTAVTKPLLPPNPLGNTFERTLSQNSGNFIITSRPSTKVKSSPGGDSSLGYLFGDKSS